MSNRIVCCVTQTHADNTHTRLPLRWHGRDWVNKGGNLICGLKCGDAPNHRAYSILFSFQPRRAIGPALIESVCQTHTHTHTNSLCGEGDRVSVSQINIVNGGRVEEMSKDRQVEQSETMNESTETMTLSVI